MTGKGAPPGRKKAQIIQPTGELRKRAVNYKKGFSVELTSTEMIQLEKVVHDSKDKFVAAVGEKLKSLRDAARSIGDDVMSIPGFLKAA